MEKYIGTDRRSDSPMELQTSLLKLLANVESMEKNVETKLENIKDKISNLDNKVSARIDHIEKQIDTHVDDDGSINETLADHDKKIMKAEAYVDRIHALEKKYTILNDRVDELEFTPTKNKAKIITDFSGIIKNVFYTALSVGILGLIIWLVTNYIRSK